MKYSIILKQLQMAYMVVTIKKYREDEQCLYCWQPHCNCNGNTVKNDPFINMIDEILPIESGVNLIKYA